jgi:glutaminyl-peptide cyclotransferase
VPSARAAHTAGYLPGEREEASAVGLARELTISLIVFGVCVPCHAQIVRPEVIASFPHDKEAFTQGLLLHEGAFVESTGLTGRSSLRRVMPATGEVQQQVNLDEALFGEGIAQVSDRFIQLTWQDQVALVYDLDFSPRGTFEYEGEGWGLCYDGMRLVMSDGSSRLHFRDPETFQLLSNVEVVRDGMPVSDLNELECVGSLVYANVWQTEEIVRIDPASGSVLTTLDASDLLTPAEREEADVLNGIAFDEATGDFFLTGKLWPKVFQVRFDFEPGSATHDQAGDAGSETEPDASAPVDAGVDGSTGAPPLAPERASTPPESTAGRASVPRTESPPSSHREARAGDGCSIASGGPVAGNRNGSALALLLSLGLTCGLPRRARARAAPHCSAHLSEAGRLAPTLESGSSAARR